MEVATRQHGVITRAQMRRAGIIASNVAEPPSTAKQPKKLDRLGSGGHVEMLQQPARRHY